MKKLTTLTTIALATTSLVSNAEELKQTLDLGVTLTRGNSETLLASLGYTVIKETPENEYLANIFYTYGEDTGEVTNDEILAAAAWKHLFNDRFYGGVRATFRADSLADIDYRAQISPVLGYFFLKDDKVSLSVEAGPGLTVEQVGGDDNVSAHVYVGEAFEYKFSEKTRIYQSAGIYAPFDDFGSYNIVAEAGVETSLSDKLSLKVYVQDKYEAEPAAGADANDFKLVTGISYKF